MLRQAVDPRYAALHPSVVLPALARHEHKLFQIFPDKGNLRRELYAKHVEFFKAGADNQERCFMAANQTGKTEAGAYEATLHLTGLYPKWWEGFRFDHATEGWACGENSKAVRGVIQTKLLGPLGQRGSGMIPIDLLRKVTTKQGTADAVDTIYVKHVSGGTSAVTLKTYKEGWKSFTGAVLDWCWLDETVPENIYNECKTRVIVSGGPLWWTFTPLEGLTELVLRYLPGGVIPDVPLPEEDIKVGPHLYQRDEEGRLIIP
jgi:phage terminase large subunit-like protein